MVVPPAALGREGSLDRLRWGLYRICIGFRKVLHRVGKDVKRTHLVIPRSPVSMGFIGICIGFRKVLYRVGKGVKRTPPGHSPISDFPLNRLLIGCVEAVYRLYVGFICALYSLPLGGLCRICIDFRKVLYMVGKGQEIGEGAGGVRFTPLPTLYRTFLNPIHILYKPHRNRRSGNDQVGFVSHPARPYTEPL